MISHTMKKARPWCILFPGAFPAFVNCTVLSLFLYLLFRLFYSIIQKVNDILAFFPAFSVHMQLRQRTQKSRWHLSFRKGELLSSAVSSRPQRPWFSVFFSVRCVPPVCFPGPLGSLRPLLMFFLIIHPLTAVSLPSIKLLPMFPPLIKRITLRCWTAPALLPRL